MNSLDKTFVFILFVLLFQFPGWSQQFTVEALNDQINSKKYDEISPVLSLDGKTLFFTRVGSPDFEHTLKINGIDLSNTLNSTDYKKELSSIYSKIAGRKVLNPEGSEFNQDIWIAESVKKDFEKIIHPGFPINNALPNSVTAITPNGNEVIVINRYHESGGMEKGFSVSRKTKDGSWTFPKSMNIQNYFNTNSDVNLAMSPDGNICILSMQRPDSYGENDLYVSFKTGFNEWSEPKNLGGKVNTSKRETTPFISEDTKRIFFSSNRRESIGGNDIYFIERLDDTWENWSVPFRFVAPLNSEADDSQPYFNSATGYLYFTSTRNGSSDIFRARLAPPNPVFVTIKGKIINTKTNQTMPGKILFAPEGEEHLQTVYVSDDGTYEMSVPKGKKINLIAEIPGFINQEESVSFRKDYIYYKEYEVNFEIEPMEVDAKVELKPIFFERSKAVVLEKSYAALDELADFLNENWNVYIRIEGHTDNRGDKNALQQLSDDRANAIKNYLVQKKFVQPLRIETIGFGAKKPLNNNSTDELRAKNRRVEVVITKVNDPRVFQTNN